MSIDNIPMPRWHPITLLLILGGLYGMVQVEPNYRRSKEYERMKGDIQGTVIQESYIPSVVKFNKNSKSNGLDSKYTLKIKTEKDDTLAVSVVDGRHSATKKESVDALVSIGSVISFPKGTLFRRGALDYGRFYEEDTFFDYTTHGSKRADRIRVLSK